MSREGFQDQRVARMEREVREVVATKMRRVRLETPGLVTVSRVWISGDLRIARIYVTVLPIGELSEEKAIKLVIEELNEMATEFQADLGKQIKTRYTPKVEFEFDAGQEQGLRVQKLIKDVEDERKQRESAENSRKKSEE